MRNMGESGDWGIDNAIKIPIIGKVVFYYAPLCSQR
jgi:hypothetical protein